MFKALLYAAALTISILILGWLAVIAILPIAFIAILLENHTPKTKYKAK